MHSLFLDGPLLGMSNATVAANARESVVVAGAASIDIVSDLRVATPAGILRDRAAAGLHENRLMEIAGREGVGMPEAVIGLRPVFAHDVVWGMAIVAGRHRPMTGLHPGVKMILHDMAVRARLWVVGKIRTTASVDERVAADSRCQPEQSADCDRCGADTIARVHLSSFSTDFTR